MSFEFVNKDLIHREYPNTFLMSAIVEIGYSYADTIDDGMSDRLSTFVRQNFNIQDADFDFAKGDISLKRGDGNLMFQFGHDKTYVMVGPKDYHTFVESVAPHLIKARLFIKDVLCRTKVSTVNVHKINVFRLEPIALDTEANPLEIEKLLFSDRLLSVPSVDIAEGECTPAIRNKRYVWRDNCYVAVVDVALGEKLSSSGRDESDKSVSTIMDIGCGFSNQSNIALADLEDRAIELNNTAYQLYHWSVSDGILSIMKNESK